ncbi:MAG: DinB family protein [Anaerolineae bacterium]|nr:DinB family protein [Anaerolineae bacterium]
MLATADKIRELITTSKPRLLSIPLDTANKKASPESWSKQEILGHLIDSAANNHQRFVRGAQNVAADFPTYHQSRWVEVQGYNLMNWVELVDFFAHYNLHLCRVIDALPEEVLNNPCHIGQEKPVPLSFVIEDYLRHLRQHLVEILEPPV